VVDVKVATLLANDRPDRLRQVAESWQAALRPGWEWRARLEPTAVVEQNRALLEPWIPTIEVNPTQAGVALNPWLAQTKAFEDGAEFAVIAEDDAEVSQDVLEYLDWACETYRHDTGILAVSTRAKVQTGPEHGAERRKWFEALCWGTWADRWPLLSEYWSWDGFGYDCQIGLRLVHWFDVDCLFPTQSRVLHIGRGYGTHVTPETSEEAFDCPNFRRDHASGEWVEV
jgi:hypothetical protein